MNTAAARRVAKAAEAQQEGIQRAILRGDIREEQARRLSLWRMTHKQAQAERTEADFTALLARMQTEAARVSKVDWLAKLATDPRNGIGDVHMRAAGALREHMEALETGACELKERVDGGKIHNGQMEALCDRRKPGRYALNAAKGAVTDQRLVPGVLAIVIWKRSVPQGLAVCGFAKTGRMHARMVDAIVEALDAAAAHIGIAK